MPPAAAPDDAAGDPAATPGSAPTPTPAPARAAADEPVRYARLMAATDGSDAARTAVERAIELASAHAASIELVHVTDEQLARLEPRAYAREVDETCRPLEQAAADRDVPMTRHVVPGRASTVLVEQAATLGVDLVVLGARGRTAFDRLLLGSVTDRVIRRAPRPVLVVHPGDVHAMDDVRTVLAGVDFSEHTAAVLREARRLLAARSGPAVLELVHADAFNADPMVHGAAAAGGDVDGDRGADLHRRLSDLAASIREPGLVVEACVDALYPVDLLDREARQRSADVIVVGRSGRGNLERLLLGSVAQRVVEHARCPVVVAAP